MQSQSKKTLAIALLLSSFALSAAPTHLVILKSDYSTSSSGQLTKRYAHVRKVMDLRFSRVLKPFLNELRAGRAFGSQSKVVYLPIINAVGLELSEAQVSMMRSHPQVKEIVPNSKVELIQPVGRTTVVHPTRNQETLNEALTLHHVDKLIEMGVDINKPGKIVGIIDTGIDGKHPDLADKVIQFRRFFDGSGAHEPVVDSGDHGTHVAGIVAGGKTSGVQLGVYPGAKLLIAAGLGGSSGSWANLLLCLQWMIDPDGDPKTPDQPFVINNSWGGGGSGAGAILYPALQALKDANILVAFAAGNNGKRGIGSPSEHPTTFTSAALDVNGKVANFSSWGPAIFQGNEVTKPEVASMGADVLSTLPNGKYGKMSGTSMASPFTTGAVALLGAHFPQLSAFTIAEALLQSCESYVPTPLRVSWHKQYGNGSINVHRAYLNLKARYGKN